MSGDVPDRDEVTKAWGDSILGRLDPPVRSVFRGGRWVAVEDGTAVFAVPNAYHCQRAEGKSREVAEAITAHFGVRVRVRVVVDEGAESLVASAPPDVVPSEPDDVLTAAEVADLEVAEAPPPGVSAEEKLRLAFPGTEEIP